MNPKVSVALITFNHERFVAQALDAAVGQRTSFPFEIVVADDASTDDTPLIVEEYARRYPSIVRLLARPSNLGMNANVADAILSCQGQYIALLEGDDFWSSAEKLQTQADVLDANPTAALCVHNVSVHYEPPAPGPLSVTRARNQELGIEDVIAYRWPLPTCGTMFRNHLLREFPAWYYAVHNCDYAIQILLAEFGNVVMLDRPMGVYRKHAAGISESTGREYQLERLLQMLAAVNAHFDWRYDRVVRRRMAEVQRAHVGLALRNGRYATMLASALKFFQLRIGGRGARRSITRRISVSPGLRPHP